MRIHKNRIWPSVIFSIIILFAIMGFGISYVARMAVESYDDECNNYNNAISEMAQTIGNQVEFLRENIVVYSEVLKDKDLSHTEEIMQILQKFNMERQYSRIGIINKDGTGYLEDGTQLIPDQYLVEKIFNEKDNLFCNGDGNLCISSCLNDNCAVIGITRELINVDQLGCAFDNINCGLYLLDENNRIVFSTGNVDNEKFNFDDISKNDFYRTPDSWTELKQNYVSNDDLSDEKIDFMSGLMEFRTLELNTGCIWYAEIVNLKTEVAPWKVLVAKPAAVSESTIKYVRETTQLILIMGGIIFVMLMFYLIARKRNNSKLFKLAYIDKITNLSNFNKFKYDAKRILKRRKGNKYAIISIDVANFKLINDMFGNKRGDQLLRMMADVLKDQIGRKELTARYTADDFLLLLNEPNREQLNRRIEKINSILLNDAEINNLKFFYGVYEIEDYSAKIDQMVVWAFIAKDDIKKNPDKLIAYFDNKNREKLHRDKQLEDNAEKAFANHEFNVYLQPKYSADGEKVKGAEALVRWISPELGFISPGDFIPLFERNLMIIKLDLYMLKEVCKVQKKWMDEGKELVTVSVNLSRAHLRISTVVEDIAKIVDEYKLPHSCIEIELTESAFFDDKEVLLNKVRELQSIGFLVSMDDFGSGYSSLNSLKDLPLDIIKLDCEFFAQAADADRGNTVIKDTIAMAKHLNMEIVAEGIETKDQVDMLNDMGCDMIQGFYFAKPMPIDEFEKTIYKNQVQDQN